MMELKFKDGRVYKLASEKGKYYTSKSGLHFRKSDPDILSVKEIKEEPKEAAWKDIDFEEEPLEKEEKKVKKPAKQKKEKKGE